MVKHMLKVITVFLLQSQSWNDRLCKGKDEKMLTKIQKIEQKRRVCAVKSRIALHVCHEVNSVPAGSFLAQKLGQIVMG